MTKPLQYPYRFPSAELRARVEHYASEQGRSINSAITALLTKALAAECGREAKT